LQRLETSLPGVVLLEPKLNSDARGFFLESYHRRRFEELGINDNFVQDNHSKSSKNSVRGLHYQLKHAQAKLCRVVRGEVLDVAADIRFGSPHFGKWVSVVLSEDNKRQIYVPAGFAHGFAVLSGTAEFLYKCSDYYHPEDEFGVLWNDPALGIAWGISNPLLSPKDGSLPRLETIAHERLPRYMSATDSHTVRARVLSLGKHPQVLKTRHAVLEQAGYEVVSATSVEEALQKLASQRIDAVIIGYTFSKAEKKELTSHIARDFNVPVLLLYIKPADLEIPATGHANAIHGEDALLASLGPLIARR
jgi:dTDP-4-dehydrorhamnose 3,5-epimerase